MNDITLKTAGIGDRIRFGESKAVYTIQARDDRFIICTRVFALKNTVIYTVVDLEQGIRGADNHYSLGYETRKQCERALRHFRASYRWLRMRQRKEPDVGFQPPVEVSHRNRVELAVERIWRP